MIPPIYTHTVVLKIYIYCVWRHRNQCCIVTVSFMIQSKLQTKWRYFWSMKLTGTKLSWWPYPLYHWYWAYSQIMLKTPVLILLPKLNSVEPCQYLDGGLFRHTSYCKQSAIIIMKYDSALNNPKILIGLK